MKVYKFCEYIHIQVIKNFKASNNIFKRNTITKSNRIDFLKQHNIVSINKGLHVCALQDTMSDLWLSP